MDKKGLEKITGLFQSWADAVKGRNVKAEEAEALRVLQEVAKNPPKDTPGSLARAEAHRCESVFDWAGAEKAYRRAVEVDNQPMGKSMNYNSLCALYGLLGRDDDALVAAREATKLARQADIPSMTSHALSSGP